MVIRDATIYRYIDIIYYHDTLSSDTVSIHILFRSYRYCDISMYRHQNVYLYIQLMLQLYIMAVNFAALQVFIA